jgi:hypothetical protein
MKSEMYKRKVDTWDELLDRITEAIARIPSVWLLSEHKCIHPKSFPNKNEHVRAKTNERNLFQSVRLALCSGVHLVQEFDVFFFLFSGLYLDNRC